MATHGRPAISELIRVSGKLADDSADPSLTQLASFASTITGGSANLLLADGTVGRQLSERFAVLANEVLVERDFASPYATVVGALVLALQARKSRITAAFDTSSGARVETSKATADVNGGPYTLRIAIVDDPDSSSTRLSVGARAFGLNPDRLPTKALGSFGTKLLGRGKVWLNAQVEQLLNKTGEYLAAFKS